MTILDALLGLSMAALICSGLSLIASGILYLACEEVMYGNKYDLLMDKATKQGTLVLLISALTTSLLTGLRGLV